MIIHCKNREEWLKERNNLVINASDAAAILGYDAGFDVGRPRRSALSVYASKKNATNIEDNDAMLLGRCLEDGISQVYTKKTGRKIFNPGDYTIFVHDEIPWIGATPDRIIAESDKGANAPLEIKHANWFKRHEWENEIPLWLQIQLQIQMACCNSNWGSYCAVIGGIQIEYGDVDLASDFFESSIPVFEKFKWRLENNRPPESSSYRDLDIIKHLYKNDNGEEINLNDDMMDLADELVIEKSNLKKTEKKVKEIESKIRQAIGDNTFGKLPDGSIIELKTTHNKGYTKTVKPYSYRTLRRR